MSGAVQPLVDAAKAAHVFKIMGENRKRTVTLDVSPARAMFVAARVNEVDSGPTPPALAVQTYRYDLEDQMFGTTTFVALTCQGHVIAGPIRWTTWEALAKTPIC